MSPHPDDAHHFFVLRADMTPDQRRLDDTALLVLALGHALVTKGVLTLAEIEQAGQDVTDDHWTIATLVEKLHALSDEGGR